MKIELISAGDLSADLLERWSHLQQAHPCLESPFFHPQFTRAVAAVRDDVQVAVLEDAGQVAGFFPFQRGALGQGLPAGAFLNEFHGLIAPPDLAIEPAGLLRACRLRNWEFTRVPAAQSALQPACFSSIESAFVDLSSGGAAFIEEKKKAGVHIFDDARRRLKKLQREVGPVHFDPAAPGAQVLPLLMQWKSEQYQRTGLSDIFAVDWARELIHNLCTSQTDNFGGKLATLYAAEKPVAIALQLQAHDVWHGWLMAFDRQYQAFSPGMVLLLKLLESAESQGVRMLHMGVGDEQFKQRLASGYIPLRQGCAYATGTAAALRTFKRRIGQAVRATPLRGVVQQGRDLLRRWTWGLRYG